MIQGEFRRSPWLIVKRKFEFMLPDADKFSVYDPFDKPKSNLHLKKKSKMFTFSNFHFNFRKYLDYRTFFLHLLKKYPKKNYFCGRECFRFRLKDTYGYRYTTDFGYIMLHYNLAIQWWVCHCFRLYRQEFIRRGPGSHHQCHWQLIAGAVHFPVFSFLSSGCGWVFRGHRNHCRKCYLQ